MTPANIMIVEDNFTVARNLRDCLESLGYGVACLVASGEESIEKAEAQRPDVIIMDIHLRDEMDGIEAAEKIHERFEIPVVFLSAYSDRGLLERAKKVGSFGYLVKPFEERELYATLEMALYKAKAEKERREMEVRLRQAEKMESLLTMAGSIAHNFNNILQGALGFLELALDETLPVSKVKQHVQKVDVSLKRAAVLSAQMLIYVGQGQEKVESVNLSNFVKSALDHLKSATQKNISLSINLAREHRSIKADPAQLRQLITNLFTNAVEAIGDEEGTITVATRVADLQHDDLKETYLYKDLPAGNYAILKVTDTGGGMDEKTLANIFDPFYTTKFTGRGLGLATVLGITKGHNGAIKVQSAPAEGTTFQILLPLKDDLEENQET